MKIQYSHTERFDCDQNRQETGSERFAARIKAKNLAISAVSHPALSYHKLKSRFSNMDKFYFLALEAALICVFLLLAACGGSS